MMGAPATSDIMIIGGNSHPELANLVAKYVFIFVNVNDQYVLKGFIIK